MFNLDGGMLIEGEIAEHWVNTASLEGKDWLAASNCVNHTNAASCFDDCRAELEERFRRFRDAQVRENQDRINLMVKSLQHHLSLQTNKINERIQFYKLVGSDKQRRMIPAEEGKLKALKKKIGDRIDELRAKSSPQAHATLVSAGVIRIH